MTRDAIIEVKDVYKNFRVYFDKGSMLKEQFVNPGRSRYEEREILRGISFKVYRGETLALIGQNGCGKSTTLKMLTKILYPNKGSVTVNGKVSSLIELGAGFHPDMSGRENIYINASILGIKKEEVDKRIDEIIRFSELEEYIDNPIRTYSSGMYMRLAFSVAINVDADILLIDEILAVGDQAFQEKCIRKLDELRASGVTVVLVSHSMNQIQEIADRCIWIENGQIREDGDTASVCEHYEEAMTRRREERDELEESERKRQELERSICDVKVSGSISDDNAGITDSNHKKLNKEKIRKIKKAQRDKMLQDKRKKQEAFSSKWKGGGIQGRYLISVVIIMLMTLLPVCGYVFVIGWDSVPEDVASVTESSLLVKVFGYGFLALGRVSIPMMLMLLGFNLLNDDFSTRTKRVSYYRKVFLPVAIVWEIWAIFYQFFLYVWNGRGFNLSVWIREALLIKYIDVGNLWIMRFILLFMLLTPYVALVLQWFKTSMLRFLMIIGWVFIFLFPGLDYYGQANGGDKSFPQSLGTFCYFFFFCLGFLLSRYMQRVFKGSKEVAFFIISFVMTVWSQIFFDARGVGYLIKPTFFGVSLMALFGFDLLLRFKVEDMFPVIGSFVREANKCVIGVFFIAGAVQMVLSRFVFKAFGAQEGSGGVILSLECLLMWISVVVLSFILVKLVRAVMKSARKVEKSSVRESSYFGK
ncbi:ATP-binding cassette domain-containing protein [Butyrivibrio sp. NC3005]|uniref:ATP-binding cassette domain-containing protein n=1 Tax=Butyrivibrio sp. NC3005 TaxID=1280685 RepID=UPI00041B8677|nr:ATP-binding cassette domain-containing protein [Butyrivibrio sp. NC3005]